MDLNGQKVEFGMFPNKELNLPLKSLVLLEDNIIEWDFKDNEDIFKLAMLASHLRMMNCEIDLIVSYLPYSRMDRPNGVYSVALKCMSELINNMGFNSVIIKEPHSQESLDLINNSEPSWWCSNILKHVQVLCKPTSMFYPDAGALARYKPDTKESLPFAYGRKSRDFTSGGIEKYEIKGTVGNSVLIIDDLCSRGGTFVHAAKQLKERGAINIYLLVAHCENNIFNGEIFDHIDTVFTSHGMLDRDHPRIVKL